MTAHRITAYKVGTHKHWTSRSSLRLHVGTYKVKVRVQYRDYTVTAGQPSVKHWVGSYHYWTTPKRKLVVKDGGHRKIWHGRHNYTTGYRSLPKGAHVYYAFVSPTAGSCHFALNAKYSGHVQQLADKWQHSGYGAFVTKYAMRVRFHLGTNCGWALELRWH